MVDQIKAIDPAAEVGIRGSTVTGITKDGNPWDPTDFDLDIFVRSDVL